MKAEFEIKACHILGKDGYLSDLICLHSIWNMIWWNCVGFWSDDQLIRCQTTNSINWLQLLLLIFRNESQLMGQSMYYSCDLLTADTTLLNWKVIWSLGSVNKLTNIITAWGHKYYMTRLQRKCAKHLSLYWKKNTTNSTNQIFKKHTSKASWKSLEEVRFCN